MWRHVRQLASNHIAHLPEAFADYIAISDLQQEVATPLLPRGVRLHRIGNPVSVPDLGPRGASAAGGDFLFVGRLSPEKGTLVFAEAARRAGVTPVFVGDGPIAAELAEAYPEARLLGWRDPAGVHEAIRAARALVFPSLWYEGQPLTVLEAKGLGVPAVVSDACAGREEVEDGVTGRWFKSADADDLARMLTDLRNDATIAAMSDAAYHAYWRDPPTRERHVERITAVYREMLQGSAMPLKSAARQAAPRWAERHASF